MGGNGWPVIKKRSRDNQKISAAQRIVLMDYVEGRGA